MALSKLSLPPQVGGELGYAERTTNDTTTNTVSASAPSNKISGLSVTVVGQGLPVRVEFYCPAVTHSVAQKAVNAALLINGSMTGGQVGIVEVPTTDVVSMILSRRLLLTAGTSYTFEIGKYLGAAGTGSYICTADAPMHLVVNR